MVAAVVVVLSSPENCSYLSVCGHDRNKKIGREVNEFYVAVVVVVVSPSFAVCGLWRDLVVYLSENKRSWDSDAWLEPPVVVCVSAD